MLPLRPLATLVAAIACLAPLVAVAPTAAAYDLALAPFALPDEAWCEVRDAWIEEILATHAEGTWAPLAFHPTDEQLVKLGLPTAAALRAADLSQPTMFLPDGRTEQVALPSVATHAGAGCFGIRPGALLLTITDEAIGWCTMAHVYGAPGSYQISTAGHCGGVGDVATVVAGFGNRDGVEGPIVLDFGKYAKSTGDGGVGRDWALIGIDAAYQHLVSPTMCAWGGPTGMYTKTGATVGVRFPRNGLVPDVTVNPDPTLAQTIVHYGHGAGVGFPAGTPRAGEVIHWGADHFMFFGAISPGDSGSGSNAVGGDTLGATREAAGINTHIYVDALMRNGVGVLAGTRATEVAATLADGQLLPYPAPVEGAP